MIGRCRPSRTIRSRATGDATAALPTGKSTAVYRHGNLPDSADLSAVTIRCLAILLVLLAVYVVKQALHGRHLPARFPVTTKSRTLPMCRPLWPTTSARAA